MLTGYNLIYFAPEKWEGLWRNRQQLMSIFARQNKVLFVEPRLHLRKTAAAFRQRTLTPLDLGRPSLWQAADNLFVFRYPVWAPVSGQFPLDQLTRQARRFFFRRALHRLKLEQPIVWFSRPELVDLIDEVPDARLLIYHVVDEYTAYSTHTADSRRRLEAYEQRMMARVDLAITVSKKLYAATRALNAHTYLVANGVNFQAYRAAAADPQLPADLLAIKPPRLGYIGLIGDKLDFALLRELALARPDWSLVLLGQVSVAREAAAWQALRLLPNVHLLGPVAVTEVPGYVKGFQVGLMPYLQNRHAENIDPLKLYDYLAAGLPVVSVDIPAAREFSAYVHLAAGPQQFGQAVVAALADTAPDRVQARLNVARQHTWEARVEQISDLILARLTVKDLSKIFGNPVGQT